MSQIEIPGNVSKTRTSQCRSTIRLSWRPPKPRFVKTNQQSSSQSSQWKEQLLFGWICLFPNHQLPGSSVEPRQTPRFEHQFPPRFRKGFFKERFWLEVASEQWETKVGVYCCSTNLCKINQYYTEVITSKYLRIWNAMTYDSYDIQWTYQWHWTQRNWHRFHRIFHPETPSGWGHGPSKLPSKQFSSDLGRRLDEGQI